MHYNCSIQRLFVSVDGTRNMSYTVRSDIYLQSSMELSKYVLYNKIRHLFTIVNGTFVICAL